MSDGDQPNFEAPRLRASPLAEGKIQGGACGTRTAAAITLPQLRRKCLQRHSSYVVVLSLRTELEQERNTGA